MIFAIQIYLTTQQQRGPAATPITLLQDKTRTSQPSETSQPFETSKTSDPSEPVETCGHIYSETTEPNETTCVVNIMRLVK